MLKIISMIVVIIIIVLLLRERSRILRNSKIKDAETGYKL